MRTRTLTGAAVTTITAATLLAAAPTARAQSFTFATGDPDGRIATGSRPESSGKIEIESADDFITPFSVTQIDSATFTGLLTGGAGTGDIGQVRVEIYRVFPKDSANPPNGQVPTRTNSPSDVAFRDRDTAASNLSFTTSVVNATFTANNSVLNGINPSPNQTTGGEGAVTGQEVQFSVNFLNPILLPKDHYFFIPQVQMNTGEFMWLSAPKPITGGTGPFLPDLQSWIRDANLDPNWLRIGTDIVGGTPAPTFNGTFSLAGVASAAPEPGTVALFGIGILTAAAVLRKRLYQDPVV
jgi:hypothetical protein